MSKIRGIVEHCKISEFQTEIFGPFLSEMANDTKKKFNAMRYLKMEQTQFVLFLIKILVETKIEPIYLKELSIVTVFSH